MFEFVMYIDMFERVSSLPKYYVYIRAKAKLIFAYIVI